MPTLPIKVRYSPRPNANKSLENKINEIRSPLHFKNIVFDLIKSDKLLDDLSVKKHMPSKKQVSLNHLPLPALFCDAKLAR
jgi:hypothetical protein